MARVSPDLPISLGQICRLQDHTRRVLDPVVQEAREHVIHQRGAAEGEHGHAAQQERVVFHPPCTLQHGQKIRGVVEQLLSALGAEVLPLSESHLCCGSAGTYSLLQPEISQKLLDNKVRALAAGHPHTILTANIGCQTHLDGAGRTPVRHWIELVDAALA